MFENICERRADSVASLLKLQVVPCLGIYEQEHPFHGADDLLGHNTTANATFLLPTATAKLAISWPTCSRKKQDPIGYEMTLELGRGVLGDNG